MLYLYFLTNFHLADHLTLIDAADGFELASAAEITGFDDDQIIKYYLHYYLHELDNTDSFKKYFEHDELER